MGIGVVIVAYDAGPRLVRCVESLADDAADGVEIVVVNNGARSPEIEWADQASFVKLLEPGGNVGFATGCNLGVSATDADTLVFLNPDTVVAPAAISALASRVEDPSVGVAMARLRLLDDPDLLNSSGAALHISGLGWSSGHGEPAASVDTLREIAYANGSALAIRREVFEALGRFTDEFFIYLEDAELSWRARLAGLRVVLDPAADVYHDYEYARNPTKLYYMERNRLLLVLTAYQLRTILVLLPLLLATELGMAALAARQGWLRDKIAAWRWSLRQRGWLRAHRRETQALRRVPDRELARYLTPVVDPKMIALPAALRLANPVMRAYWAVARRVL
ncbi:MAG: glycosyltransferase family 2 protein [Gaiellaceae bacterium]